MNLLHYLGNKVSKTVSLATAILGLSYTINAAPLTTPLVKENYPHSTIYEAGIRGNAERAGIYGEAFLPIKDKLFLDGKLTEDSELGLTATLGLGHRAIKQERTYGANIFTDLSDKQTAFSLGLETFSKERKLNLHGNVYAGNQKGDEEQSINYTGVDLSAVAKMIHKDKLRVNGIFGVYSFQTDREEKANITGAKAGFELRIPLRKDSWELIADIMGYSEKELTGANYGAFIGIRHGNNTSKFEPVRRQLPYFIEEQKNIEEKTPQKTPETPKEPEIPTTPTHQGDPETPSTPSHSGD